MGLDIRIFLTELQWRNSSNGTNALEGDEIGVGQAAARAIRLNNNFIEYVDAFGQGRRLNREQVGTVEVARQRSLYIHGNELRYIGTGETPFPIYKATAPTNPPTDQPINIELTAPSEGGLPPFPWDVVAQWTNTNSSHTIGYEWARNGVGIESGTLQPNTSANISPKVYEGGDTCTFTVFYISDGGSGPSSEKTIIITDN